MGEGDTVSELPESTVNGNAAPEEKSEACVEKKETEDSGVKEMEEDCKQESDKVDADKMDVDEGQVKENEEKEQDTAEEPTAGKGSKKNAKSKSNSVEKDKKKKKAVEAKKEKELRTPMPPTIDRPVRERKSVERLAASIEKDAVKEFRVEKGRGTALKDIPNVAYKLSRKKTEDSYYENKRLDLPLLICVMVTITICFVFSIVFGIIASKYGHKEPNFVVNQSFVMNDNLSSHCPANWSMNFTIHNGNMHSSYSYKGFEVLAYYEGNGINDIFASAEIHPFSQGPENKTVIRVDFFSLVTMESYEFKAFSVEFRGKAYTHTNVANFVRRILLLDGEYIIKGKCEDLMFGGKENIATHSPKECYFCYESYSSGHKPCWY